MPAVEWWFSFVDTSFFSTETKISLMHNLQCASEEAFNEWYEREIANPPGKVGRSPQ